MPRHLCRMHPVAAALAVGLAVASLGSAQAQSSYTLTTLKSSNSLSVTPLRLDPQNNALGNAYYYSSIGVPIYSNQVSVPLFGGLAMIYTEAMSIWPAGTTSTVTAKRLASDGFGMLAASPDGRLVYAVPGLYGVSGSAAKLQTMSRFNMVGSNSVSVVYGSMGTRSLSSAGTLSSTVTLSDANLDGAERAAVWEGPNLVGRFLDQSGYRSSLAHSIADNEAVAGAVAESTTGIWRAVVWSGSTRRVLDQQAGRGSVARQVNSAGQVLACMADAVVKTSVVEGTTYTATLYSRLRPVVIDGAGEREVLAPTSGQAVTAWAMNASGVVVGRAGPYHNPYAGGDTPRTCINTDDTTSRALIWRDGVSSDLTTWVASKGVKLPSGAVLTDAYDINDQGSILAVMRASNGVLSKVRLTAKP